jgi:hypothetical protein
LVEDEERRKVKRIEGEKIIVTCMYRRYLPRYPLHLRQRAKKGSHSPDPKAWVRVEYSSSISIN